MKRKLSERWSEKFEMKGIQTDMLDGLRAGNTEQTNAGKNGSQWKFQDINFFL